MTKPLPEFDRAALSTIVRGAEKTFDNAEKLYFEAQLLAKVGSIARALFLHQISLEECSKAQTMGAWATSLVCGQEVNQKAILSSFTRHASKNKANAYMLEGSGAEKDAQARGDWKSALKEFKDLQEKFHAESNSAKNASLYADWKGGEFKSPDEQINRKMLNEIIARNEKFLGYAHQSLGMLQRLEKSPEGMQAKLIAFMETIEKTRAEDPGTARAAIDHLIDKFLEQERNKKRAD